MNDFPPRPPSSQLSSSLPLHCHGVLQDFRFSHCTALCPALPLYLFTPAHSSWPDMCIFHLFSSSRQIPCQQVTERIKETRIHVDFGLNVGKRSARLNEFTNFRLLNLIRGLYGVELATEVYSFSFISLLCASRHTHLPCFATRAS